MDALYGWGRSRESSFRAAIDSAESGLALDDQDAQVLRAAGIAHFFMRNHDVAFAYYQRAVEANPNEAENHALFGAALGVAGDYEGALERLASLREPVDAFFDGVMVMTDDADQQRNRLALLSELRARFLDVADLSCIPTS